MERFFSIGHEQRNKTPYTSKILSDNKVFLSDCPRCGRARFNHSNMDLTLLIEGKGILPDFLLCGHYPLKIVSDRVIKAWEIAGITGYNYFPVKLIDAQHKEVSKELPYYNVIITGRAELDLQKMNVEVTNICDICGSIEYNKQTWEFGKAIMKKETYDNSDLLTFMHFEAAPVCTIKVLEAVYKNKLSNFTFQDYETKFMYMTATSYVNLREMFA